MEYPTLRFVFDRKKVASKDKKGLVQIEICSQRKRKWIGTGVKVYSDQWDDKKKVVRSVQSVQLNLRLDSMMAGLMEYVNSLIQRKIPFDFEALDLYLKNATAEDSYIQFAAKRVEERRDISEGTRKHHRTFIKVLEKFGKINYFHDLTKANITLFDEFLRGRGIKDTTLYNYHKFNKVYINEAIRFGLIHDSPYTGIKLNRGKSNKRKYLTAEEMYLLKECDIPDEKISRARDLFLFQCYTGLSYSDLYKFDFERDVIDKDGKFVIFDRRQKTNEDYYIVLLSPAMEILRRHDYHLPRLSNQKYNDYIKVAASYAHIGKELSSHAARHTFAVFALNNGVPIEVVSKMLGHTNIRTTQLYAKILNTAVEKGFDILESKISGKPEL